MWAHIVRSFLLETCGKEILEISLSCIHTRNLQFHTFNMSLHYMFAYKFRTQCSIMPNNRRVLLFRRACIQNGFLASAAFQNASLFRGDRLKEGRLEEKCGTYR